MYQIAVCGKNLNDQIPLPYSERMDIDVHVHRYTYMYIDIHVHICT